MSELTFIRSDILLTKGQWIDHMLYGRFWCPRYYWYHVIECSRIMVRRPQHAHSICHVHPGTITLFITGPRLGRTWGFYTGRSSNGEMLETGSMESGFESYSVVLRGMDRE